MKKPARTPKQRVDAVLARVGIESPPNYENLIKLMTDAMVGEFDTQAIEKYAIENFARYKIEGDLSERHKKCLSMRGFTKEKSLLVYGEDEGIKRWQAYCNKQSVKNTFAHKNKKYGMTREQFDEFNKSRSSTIDNMIARYGEEEGKKRWKEYCDKQAYAGCKLQYFIDKHGEDEGTRLYNELNKKKSNTLDVFIDRYGEVEGTERYENYMNTCKVHYSEISQELFREIEKRIGNSYGEMYFQTRNREFGKHSGSRYYFYDFVLLEKKIVIEFNGNLFHANPTMYHADDIPKFRGNTMTAQQLWDRDAEKFSFIESLGFKLIVVWEADYNNDKETIIQRIVDAIHTT